MDDRPPSLLTQKVLQVQDLYYRLLLVASPTDGLWPRLRRLSQQTGYPLVNASLELSRRLLPLRTAHRPLSAADLLADALDELGGPITLLGAIELLFEPSLRQDPLRLLQSLARRRTLVVGWNGPARDGYLFYAQPGHPEYRRYPTGDLVLIEPDALV